VLIGGDFTNWFTFRWFLGDSFPYWDGPSLIGNEKACVWEVNGGMVIEFALLGYIVKWFTIGNPGVGGLGGLEKLLSRQIRTMLNSKFFSYVGLS